jgi:hypothetical protein
MDPLYYHDFVRTISSLHSELVVLQSCNQTPLWCTVQYSTFAGIDSEAYEGCTTAIIAAASLPTILAQSRAKNIVCAHHEIVRTKVI